VQEVKGRRKKGTEKGDRKRGQKKGTEKGDRKRGQIYFSEKGTDLFSATGRK
jgi:hypothetical protein